MGNAEWRVFCAVDLPKPTRMDLLEHIQRLRSLLPQVQASWSRDTNIHLTLKFLGEIPQTSVAAFELAVAKAVAEVPRFSIVISGAGVFPNRRDPRVLWIGVQDPEGQLAKLHAHLERECEQKGFPRDERQFHPHLTVARLRNQGHARELTRAHEELEFAPEEIDVREVLVIRSELGSGGSRYTTLSQHPLKG